MNSFENKYANLMATATMMAIEVGSGFSLADFANTETDDIKELNSLLMPVGTYAVKITELKLGEREKKEGIDPKTGMEYLPLYYLARQYEVLEANLVDKTEDPDRFIGRKINDSVTFWPSDVASQIGLLKGDFKRCGIPNSGRMGGLEGGEPGWIDGGVDKIIGLKCTHGTRNGEQFARYKWFKLDTGEAEQEAAA
jgi:hypothetical protein